ncbi:MAG: hypothetical protein HFJ63_06775 [Atopobiaceae bacterium]|jgi:hypothetical protein|uniref:Uncharacterized protein n=1 Tax=Muricaecibacterium torontonense TaxID=3032871 RepID=A0A4S2EZA6_9ACTN|nr:hypothetical protein [Muricaecibacterium torontonense]MCI8676392.1 hypothetical protein [Atopobiaceae bacterium]TGY61715.1 hypothetical protein E5334_06835 [Muricaecibacterium torontonense]
MLKKQICMMSRLWHQWWGPSLRSDANRSHIVGALIVILGVVALGCGAVWSFLTTQSQVQRNDFKVALQTIEVDEEFDPIPDEEGWVTKRVRFINTGDCSCFVRALITPSIDDAATNYKFDLDGWTAPDEDGWRYCLSAIEPQAATPYVLDGFTAHSSSAFDIYVLGESVQAEGFQSPQEAFEALRGSEPGE